MHDMASLAAGTGKAEAAMSGLSRRGFLGRAGAAAAVAGAGMLGVGLDAGGVPARAAEDLGPIGRRARADQAFGLRIQAAKNRRAQPAPAHTTNGDDGLYATNIGSYSKGLPHNALGEVDTAAYAALLRAVFSCKPADFEAIPLGGTVKLADPQAAYTFDLEGPDSHQLYLDPAPAFGSAEIAAEMAEDYWMALARDIPFADYNADPLIARAASDLSRFAGFTGPRAGSAISPGTLFRGPTPGDLAGPYVSQFLWAPVPYGVMTLAQRYPALPSRDYLTTYPAWLANQRGQMVPSAAAATVPPVRYISSGRDLATYVHADFTYQAYLNACLILGAIGAPLDGNPYHHSRTQVGFITFGAPHVLDYLARAANAALKAAWFQKWVVHRRLRPEAFAGRVHNQMTGAERYPIHEDLTRRSSVLSAVYQRHGSYLLPMAYPEGCPAHPSYPAGHAAIAGACVTILKALYDESFSIPQPVVAGAGGQTLNLYSGPPLTVGGELNKLAANIALGRDIAGVHWRSDGIQGMLLGEAVAMGILQDRSAIYNESFRGFALTRFDGTTITI
jgi:hypothetical protein